MSAPNTDQEPSEPDPSPDQDSAYDSGSSIGSVYASVRSSIYNYREEYGRRYHPEEHQYPYPIDEQEKDRLDLQHTLFRVLLDNKLFLAPISPSPANILDVGTGTGIWAIEIADQYPGAIVIGIDRSPMQPTWVPVNCEFHICDANDTWNFARKFDFIHCRELHMALEEKQLFRQAWKALNPRGWLEIKEIALPLQCLDDTLKGTAILKWHEEMMRASKAINTRFDKPHHYRQWMEEAGFVNVKEVVYCIPQNPWPKDAKLKELGKWQMANLLEGLEGFSLALFINYLGYSRAELEVLLAGVRKDVTNRGIHAYWNVVGVIGQKPPI